MVNQYTTKNLNYYALGMRVMGFPTKKTQLVHFTHCCIHIENSVIWLPYSEMTVTDWEEQREQKVNGNHVVIQKCIKNMGRSSLLLKKQSVSE